MNDKNTLARLQERHLHPTEKYRRRKDGKHVLTMKLQGTAELESWVLSWGPKVTVLKPKSIRESVRRQLKEATARYG